MPQESLLTYDIMHIMIINMMKMQIVSTSYPSIQPLMVIYARGLDESLHHKNRGARANLMKLRSNSNQEPFLD